MAFLSTVLRSVVCFMIIKGVLGDPLEKTENVPITCLQTLTCNISLCNIYDLSNLDQCTENKQDLEI